MDVTTAVFNAARDGKLKLIQKLLSNKTPEELEALAEEKTQGGTALLIASRHGHLEVVDYFLEHCKANVELGGAVNFDGETIEAAHRCGRRRRPVTSRWSRRCSGTAPRSTTRR